MSPERLREQRFDVGDIIKRYNMLDSDKESTSAAYIIINIRKDEEGWIWYTCYSFGTGNYREFLLDDDVGRKYVKLA